MAFEKLVRHQKKILFVIAAILVLVWILGASLQQIFKHPSEGNAGEVFGKKVPRDVFYYFASRVKNLYWVFFPRLRSPSLLDATTLWGTYVQIEYAKKIGLTVTEDEIRGFVTQLFGREMQKYNIAYSDYIDRRFRMSIGTFEETIGEFLLRNKLNSLYLNSVSAPVGLAWVNYKDKNTKIDVSFIKIDVNDFNNDVQPPTEEEIRTFYENYKDTELRIPEKVVIGYLQTINANYTDQVEITDEELKGYYEQHKEDFLIKEPSPETTTPTPEEPALPPDNASGEGAIGDSSNQTAPPASVPENELPEDAPENVPSSSAPETAPSSPAPGNENTSSSGDSETVPQANSSESIASEDPSEQRGQSDDAAGIDETDSGDGTSANVDISRNSEPPQEDVSAGSDVSFENGTTPENSETTGDSETQQNDEVSQPDSTTTQNEPQYKQFDDVKEQIRQIIVKQKTADYARQVIGQAYNLLNTILANKSEGEKKLDIQDFEKVVTTLAASRIEKGQTVAMSRDALDTWVKGMLMVDENAAGQVLDRIFQMNPGVEFSDVYPLARTGVTGDRALFFVVLEKQAAHAPELDEPLKQIIIEKLKNIKAKQIAQKKADEWMQLMQTQGNDFKSVATGTIQRTIQTDTLQRNRFFPADPSSPKYNPIVEKAFSLEEGDVDSLIRDDTLYLFKVESINEASFAAFTDQFDAELNQASLVQQIVLSSQMQQEFLKTIELQANPKFYMNESQ